MLWTVANATERPMMCNVVNSTGLTARIISDKQRLGSSNFIQQGFSPIEEVLVTKRRRGTVKKRTEGKVKVKL
jgi:hypothetical protein